MVGTIECDDVIALVLVMSLIRDIVLSLDIVDTPSSWYISYINNIFWTSTLLS